jgi:hypothetical protein
MKLDYESIWTSIKSVPLLWRIVGLIVLLLIITAVLSLFSESCGNWSFNRNVNKQKANINALENESNAIENIVNGQSVNYANAKEQTNEARNETNIALNNLNAVRNADYNGAGYANANSARCRAYPKSNGC